MQENIIWPYVLFGTYSWTCLSGELYWLSYCVHFSFLHPYPKTQFCSAPAVDFLGRSSLDWDSSANYYWSGGGHETKDDPLRHI